AGDADGIAHEILAKHCKEKGLRAEGLGLGEAIERFATYAASHVAGFEDSIGRAQEIPGVFLDLAVGASRERALRVAQSIICERAFEFAVRILNLCQELWRRGPIGRHVASELMGCGTSIGSNAEEAQDAQTKPDYIAKMAVSRKESRETIYWLRL